MPEAQVLSALHRHQLRSLLAAALATLLATGVAWLFARHILRTRHEIAEARAEVAKAVAQVQELGSYRLVERLGKGGMGEVWRAEHRLLVRQAAIKLISIDADSAVDVREVQERFRREAQSLATLRSRNTIELFDYGVTAEGTFFYVMELLDGMDLETLVDEYGPQPAARVIHFLIQACNSLAEAHDTGLVHRDIKPANLYVCRVADEVDVVKVLDFGLVRAALRGGDQVLPSAPSSGTMPAAVAGQADDARLTQMGQAMGTPAYMAPEQALGYESDGRADIYALGCIGFWLLTGRLLFDRQGSLPMMMAHITEPPPAIEPYVAGFLPPELATLLKFCLAKQPADRPHDARALARALKAIHVPPAEQWTEARAQTWWRERSSRAAPNASNPKLGVA
jgi:eukaryotic-like serine/threonine-protein kinase